MASKKMGWDEYQAMRVAEDMVKAGISEEDIYSFQDSDTAQDLFVPDNGMRIQFTNIAKVESSHLDKYSTKALLEEIKRRRKKTSSEVIGQVIASLTILEQMGVRITDEHYQEIAISFKYDEDKARLIVTQEVKPWKDLS